MGSGGIGGDMEVAAEAYRDVFTAVLPEPITRAVRRAVS
jgi:hypothetical protein